MLSRRLSACPPVAIRACRSRAARSPRRARSDTRPRAQFAPRAARALACSLRRPASRMGRHAGTDRFPTRWRTWRRGQRRSRAGDAPERVWLIEHPPLYTAGTSAKDGDLIDARFPVYRAGRGGQFTYHGPGQRVAYVMLDLKRRRPDVRAYVAALEGWLIEALEGLRHRWRSARGPGRRMGRAPG